MDESNISSLNNLANLQQKTGLVEPDLTYFIDWYTDKLDEVLPIKLAIKKFIYESGDVEDDAINYEIKAQETKEQVLFNCFYWNFCMDFMLICYFYICFSPDSPAKC